MKTMSSIVVSPDLLFSDDSVAGGIRPDPVETGWESFEWALETLAAQFGIVVRDLERFAAMRDDPEHLAWIDEAVAALATLELFAEPFPVFDPDGIPARIEELADVLLEESDWLREQSEFVSEVFADHRLAVRLRGLSAACYEAVRCLPPDALAAPEIEPFPNLRFERGDDDRPRAA